MAVNNAYRLCLGVFKQSKQGTEFANLPKEYAGLKWDLESSIIPGGYEFTNFQVGDTTIETIEKNTITSLSKNKEFESGSVTPPTFTFANMAGADEANVIATLDKLTDVDDPFKVLFVAGAFKESNQDGVRKYDAFNVAVAIVTSDGGRSGEAKAKFTGSLALQACHIPIIGKGYCNAELEWNVTEKKIKLVSRTQTAQVANQPANTGE